MPLKRAPRRRHTRLPKPGSFDARLGVLRRPDRILKSSGRRKPSNQSESNDGLPRRAVQGQKTAPRRARMPRSRPNGETMQRRSFNEGETIFTVGDASDCAYLVVIGSVRVHLPNGRTKVLGRGEIFGEMGLIDSRPRSATVVAAEYCVFASYSEAELLDSIKTHPDDAVAFIKALIARLREANEAQYRAEGVPIPIDHFFV